MATRDRTTPPKFYRWPRTGNERRFHTTLFLTRDEIKQLQAKAAADYRSITRYVTQTVLEHLRRPRRKRHRHSLADPLGLPSDRRENYPASVWLTREQREKLGARALNETQSLSDYVGTLVLKDLRSSR